MPKDKKDFQSFSESERDAMKERIKELNKDNGESVLLAKIAEMPEHDRTMAEKIHEIVKANAPDLTAKTWYGMPAYANKEGKVVCFFKAASKYESRYATLGFEEAAHLDEGSMWQTSFALKKLGESEEKRIVELVKKAVS